MSNPSFPGFLVRKKLPKRGRVFFLFFAFVSYFLFSNKGACRVLNSLQQQASGTRQGRSDGPRRAAPGTLCRAPLRTCPVLSCSGHQGCPSSGGDKCLPDISPQFGETRPDSYLSVSLTVNLKTTNRWGKNSLDCFSIPLEFCYFCFFSPRQYWMTHAATEGLDRVTNGLGPELGLVPPPPPPPLSLIC